ncbi:grasp-with-spasm system SPASM domain peptide maturase [Perlabentimonas gracilis]|uniref:grasp-with-spasm system SPASM domain peptide maturase n=1 Tax=Perlabentimonas gracilis TaxID=2715279 RepID=UPI001408F768|nr:grasp-with-spasm system SPASM domain peptide maturase [Perlabentimonas gracilis]NHB70275.1 grasp-with-spasm system SPASM domain peptide maturase [Perlabentimonas gracilis]
MRYYKRFANCFPIDGYKNYAVYDISRKDVFAIDKPTFELLGLEIIFEELLQGLPNNRFSELLDKEIIFQCPKGDENLFPFIKTNWYSPFSITNCIVDWSIDSKYDIIKALEQLDKIGCKTLQLRFYPNIEENQVVKALKCIVGMNIRGVELVVPFSEELIKFITREFESIVSIICYSADSTSVKAYNNCQVILTKEMFLGVEQCGVVSPSYFICNNDFFFESNNHNSCLNRKISIDTHGNIKNCPSCSQSFGNINDTTLEQAFKHPDFKKHWNITKDQIDVCKDCEFRHMCTDCRVFIKDPENIYSQPAKCTYNPYIAKWQGEEGYVPVEECGTYTWETGFVVNHKRVAELNKQLWGE